MLPASQVLLGGVQGYVAEAAVPRFVTKDGDQNFLRQWELKDKIIETNGIKD